MKIILVFLFVYILVLGCDVAMDLLSGISIKETFENMMSPFVVMSFQEYAIVIIFISIILLSPLIPKLVNKIKSAPAQK